jgi:hypothetical protein
MMPANVTQRFPGLKGKFPQVFHSKNNMADEKKYRCKKCRDETTILTLGLLYSGCFKCFSRDWEEFKDGEWVDYVGRTPETDALMRHIQS